MTEVLTAEQMRQIEERAIESGAVTGSELMERAGRGVVEEVLKAWPGLAKGAHRAVVLCGPGNNGGDGFVVARLLKAAGWEVTVHAYGWDMLFRDVDWSPDMPPDAQSNAERWRAMGGLTLPLDALEETALCSDGPVVVIDALLGIGQLRSADSLLRQWWSAWAGMGDLSPANPVHCVSIDVPTGYNSDTAEALAATPFEPDLIVTFHRRKPLHPVLEAKGYRVVVTDIGL